MRMGLHTGEAIAEEGDFFGRNVILAARIAAQAERRRDPRLRDAARAGRRARTASRFDDGRELELKGMAGTHTVYRAEWEAEAAAGLSNRRGERPPRERTLGTACGRLGGPRMESAAGGACRSPARRLPGGRARRLPRLRPGGAPAAQHAERPRLRPLRARRPRHEPPPAAAPTSRRSSAPSASAPTPPTRSRLVPHSRRRDPVRGLLASSTSRAGRRTSPPATPSARRSPASAPTPPGSTRPATRTSSIAILDTGIRWQEPELRTRSTSTRPSCRRPRGRPARACAGRRLRRRRRPSTSTTSPATPRVDVDRRRHRVRRDPRRLRPDRGLLRRHRRRRQRLRRRHRRLGLLRRRQRPLRRLELLLGQRPRHRPRDRGAGARRTTARAASASAPTARSCRCASGTPSSSRPTTTRWASLYAARNGASVVEGAVGGLTNTPVRARRLPLRRPAGAWR